jgi:hypothetical protein
MFDQPGDVGGPDSGADREGLPDFDAMLEAAVAKLDAHVDAETIPGQNETTTLMVDLLSVGATPIVRDAFVTHMVTRFPDDFTRQGLKATWREIAEELRRNAADAARASAQAANVGMTPAERSTERERLSPLVKELAEAPDLLARIVTQVRSQGVVGETHLVQLVYVAGTSRLLPVPINPLIKGASSAGKSIVSQQTLRLIPPEAVLMLTTSSPLSLVYDPAPLAHKIICVYEATQLQADDTSVSAMLLRSLISEGKIIHQTTVEDKDAEYGRRTVTIVREGPISLLITTTGELHAENETRMLSIRVSETRSQTAEVLASLGARAAGTVEPEPDLSVFHDFQRWLALGPTDVVVPFAPQLVAQVPPHLVRFRRDIQQLLTFIKASALLHQAQRGFDPVGRVIATLDDYRLAYEVFVPILGQITGRSVPEGVRAVIELVAGRVSTAATAADPGAAGRFARPAGGIAAGSGEVVISSYQVARDLGFDPKTARRYIKAAIHGGYLTNRETRRGQPYNLALKVLPPGPATDILPDPDSLMGPTDAGRPRTDPEI